MIYVTGDLHGRDEIYKLQKPAFPKGRTLTKDDFVVILGDFGLIWHALRPDTSGAWSHNPPEDRPNEQEQFWLDFLSEQPWTTLFVDGNHENFDRLLKYPTQDFHGGKAAQIHDTVWHLRRGEIFELCGKQCFVMGGAASIDKQWRTPGKSWWPEEVPSPQDFKTACANLSRFKDKVDLIFTHTCPESVKLQLPLDEGWGNIAEKIGFYDPTEGMLEGFFSRLQFEHWYFAHFHIDYKVNERFTSVFNDVLEVAS